MKFEMKIAGFGKPNGNGRVYSTDMMEKTVKEYTERNKDMMLGELSHGDSTASIDRMVVHLSNVSHKFDKLYVEDGNLCGEGVILYTPNGNLVSSIGIDKFGLELVGTGNINGCEVVDFNLHHIDLIPKEKCAWPNTSIKEINHDS